MSNTKVIFCSLLKFKNVCSLNLNAGSNIPPIFTILLEFYAIYFGNLTWIFSCMHYSFAYSWDTLKLHSLVGTWMKYEKLSIFKAVYSKYVKALHILKNYIVYQENLSVLCKLCSDHNHDMNCHEAWNKNILKLKDCYIL